MSATCEGLSLLWAWGDGAPCRAGALRQYGAQPGSREVAERRLPPAHRPGVGGLPHKLAFWLLSLTESATWWPQAAVQGLVPRSGPDLGRPSPPLPPAQSSATAGFISTWAMWAEPHTLAAQPPARRRRRPGPGFC